MSRPTKKLPLVQGAQQQRQSLPRHLPRQDPQHRANEYAGAGAIASSRDRSAAMRRAIQSCSSGRGSTRTRGGDPTVRAGEPAVFAAAPSGAEELCCDWKRGALSLVVGGGPFELVAGRRAAELRRGSPHCPSLLATSPPPARPLLPGTAPSCPSFGTRTAVIWRPDRPGVRLSWPSLETAVIHPDSVRARREPSGRSANSSTTTTDPGGRSPRFSDESSLPARTIAGFALVTVHSPLATRTMGRGAPPLSFTLSCFATGSLLPPGGAHATSAAFCAFNRALARR